ncbi:MAG TPA: hypothetical protein VN851_26280 [Thermoanaerobaculia bacterium]|nr:hypothetical protein [Thermoanaerobaculia bacterium]
MRGTVKALSLGLILVGGAALAARPAEAVNYWPTANAYACTWSKPNASNPNVIDRGVSTVKFVGMAGVPPLGANYERAGRFQTTYPGGAVTDFGVTLWWDWPTGDNVFYPFLLDNGIQCRLQTSNSGHTLIFDLCNNQAVQNCTQ